MSDSKNKLLNIFKELGIDPSIRAEDIKVEEWFKLSDKLRG
jgi:16S rRNA A1518/A1519 N6-dimethyltransferase RsmA/KsgA/DIM1 with predicted DNA glycosylase/AP lyase activity